MVRVVARSAGCAVCIFYVFLPERNYIAQIIFLEQYF